MPALTNGLQGIPGREADGAQRGFFYQALVTALAWTQLDANQVLAVEIAEDLAITDQNRADVRQVKDVSKKLSLRSVLGFLENALDLQQRNKGRELTFVYVTTASIVREHAPKDRPNGKAGLSEWDAVKNGSDPSALVTTLRKMAGNGSLLAEFLSARTDEAVVADLIERVTWATAAPRSIELETRLGDELAKIAQSEYGLSKTKGRLLVDRVVQHVTRRSSDRDRGRRELTRQDLLELIKHAALVSITPEEHERAQRLSSIVESIPTELLTERVAAKTLHLRQTRFFEEAKPHDQARDLAADVLEGGQYQLASNQARSEALCWCARITVESDTDRARYWYREAVALDDSLNVRLVAALLDSLDDAKGARASLAALRKPEAQSIRYVLERRQSDEVALDWVFKNRLLPGAFDADGQFFVLNSLMLQGRWRDALDWQSEIKDDAIEQCPSLLWGMAFTVVVSASPDYQKHIAAHGPPVVDELKLRESDEAMLLSRRAALLFREFCARATRMNLSRRAEIALEYALWIEIKDERTRDAARNEVGALLQGDTNSFRWIPLALSAGLKIDTAQVRESIQRNASIFGGLDDESARALFATLVRSEPLTWIDHLSDLLEAMQPHIPAAALASLATQALASLDRLAEAEAYLRDNSAISTEEKLRLEEQLRAVSNDSSLTELAPDASPPERRAAIEVLRRTHQMSKALLNAEALFSETESTDDAELLVNLLMQNQKLENVVEFCKQHSEFVAKSNRLKAMRFYAYFNLGHWQRASEALDMATNAFENAHEMRIQLAIYSFEWGTLPGILHGLEADNAISVQQLIQLALISSASGLPRLARNFISKAIEREPENTELLFNGYMLAVRDKWENDLVVGQWLMKAISQADSKGPLQRRTLRDLADMAPAWRENADAIGRSIQTGELYLALASEAVNRTLTDVVLGTIESNVPQKNPARRTVLPTFAGIARPGDRDIPKSLLLDPTSMLLLTRLDLLDQVERCFERIYVPHTTGPWLFRELERLRFHQPSRIADAQSLIHFIAKGDLKVATSGPEVAPRVVREVGEELAQLLAMAEEDRGNGLQSFVVRPAPLHRPDSLGDVDADLSQHAALVCSTRPLIRTLLQLGAISRSVFDPADAYLSARDQGWGEESLLPQGATLYLDDLTVTYLNYVGILGRLRAAGFSPLIHPNLQREADGFLQVGDKGVAMRDSVDRLSAFLAKGTSGGQVVSLAHVDEDANVSEGGKSSKLRKAKARKLRQMEVSASRMLLDMFGDLEKVECVIFDDRAANRFLSSTDRQGISRHVGTTLDVLDWLLQSNTLTPQDWQAARMKLRSFGCALMPVSASELSSAVEQSKVVDGQLLEGFDARMIRESLLLVQGSGFLQLPQEAPWLASIGHEVRTAIRDLWNRGGIDESTWVRSNWLVELSRMSGFSSVLLGTFDPSRLADLDALTIAGLMLDQGIVESSQEQFATWLEESYLRNLALRKPRAFASVCRIMRAHLEALPAMADDPELPVSASAVKAYVARFARATISRLPPSVRMKIMEDKLLLQKLGLESSSHMSFHIPGEPTFDITRLYDVAKKAIDSSDTFIVKDDAGDTWNLASQDGTVHARDQGNRHKVPIEHAALFSEVPAARERYLESRLRAAGLASEDRSVWTLKMAQGPMSVEELSEFDSDIADTPVSMAVLLTKTFRHGEASLSSLVPESMRYYRRLAGDLASDRTLKQYVERTRGYCYGSDSVSGLEHALLRSIHPATSPVALIAEFDVDALAVTAHRILPTLDSWSLIGLLEGIARRDDVFERLEGIIVDVIERIREITSESSVRPELTIALCSLVDGSVNTSGRLSDQPAFWRRLASFSHAALIERTVLRTEVPLEDFTKWADNYLPIFQVATLGDLPSEPRWGSFLFTPSQFRQELLGRAMAALEPHRQQIESAHWKALVYGEDLDSLESRRQPILAGLAGPLEGAIEETNRLPAELLTDALVFLNDPKTDMAKRLQITAHFGGLGLLSPDVIVQLTKAVKDLDLDLNAYSHDVPIDWSRVFVMLGYTAAGSRDRAMSDAVMQQLRQRSGLPFAARIYAALTACAWTADLGEWYAAVANCIDWLAVDLAQDDARYLLFVVETLCDAQPMLLPKISSHIARIRGTAMQLGW